MGRKRGTKSHPQIDNQKWCFVCLQYKDLTEFHPNRSTVDGRKSVCKTCSGAYEKDYQRQYYLDHRDDLLLRHRVTALESYYRREGSNVKSSMSEGA